MSEGCHYRARCEAGAFLEEAQIVSELPDATIQDLGWEDGVNVVVRAALDTLAELTNKQRADLQSSLPCEPFRCSDCYLGRNALLKMLGEDSPDYPDDNND